MLFDSASECDGMDETMASNVGLVGERGKVDFPEIMADHRVSTSIVEVVVSVKGLRSTFLQNTSISQV